MKLCPHTSKPDVIAASCSMCLGIPCERIRMVEIEGELDRLAIKRALGRAADREKTFKRSMVLSAKKTRRSRK